MRSTLTAIGFALLLPASSAVAQGGLLLQGTLDLEGWKTDTSSTLLTRNHGDLASLYRLRLWSAVEPWRGVFLFANAEAEGGNARQFDGPGTSVDLEQGGIRIARHPSFVIDAGKMTHPLGGFAGRVLSTRNPLIGVPDGYSPVYPLGLKVSGERGKVDYRAAVVMLPLTHRDYVPDPDQAPRPVVGIGITPVVGLRFGMSAMDGPYLNGDLSDADLHGRGWRSYHQRVLAAEARYGFAHFDLRAEVAGAKYEVPGSGWISGTTGYVEARATLTPRLFAAVRGEVNDYPFIRPSSSGNWTARPSSFRDLEVGGGYRFGANTLLKASWRMDDWDVTSDNYGFVRPGGNAFAVQVSRAFDIADWLNRVR
jgi:hypothetical protein